MTTLDLYTAEMTAAFAVAPLYVKKAVVEIRRVQPGAVIETVLADGRVETVATADADRCWLVTNPGGEKYLITADKVQGRYVPLSDGRYQAKGAVRAFPNPTGRTVTVIAPPWGEEQHGGHDAFVAVAVDAYTPHELGNDRYLIGRAEFAETYVEA